MTKLATLIGLSLAAGTAMAVPAQAYEWGGGSCIGYGCVRAIHEGEYRPVRSYRYDEERPAVRVIERRHRVYRHHDWDEDDDD
ncbi:hypothetical protein [Methylobacterium nigriterrae]|uniref:hypothetical protein n=1 Tax=Methylobacterium nigriterrae TaxID=3127512 RepID=UPI0030141958